MAVLPTGIGPVTNGGYQIERSLRFNSADSAYLNRTPASSGSRTTWTWSGWVKRGALGANNAIFSCGSYSTDLLQVYFEDATNSIRIQNFPNSTTANVDLLTTAVYRDLSAWYHIVVVMDTTQATSSNRVKLYVNGVQVTVFSTATYPAQNATPNWNTGSVAHHIGARISAVLLYSGYMTEIYFIDGQALTPSSFGETDSATGVWKPKAYSGTYGTNGFFLKFADNSGTTSTTLGKDYSGNGNNWTPNNFSVTAGAGNDSLVDSPTSYGTDTGVGGEVRGNYCTLNPLDEPATYAAAGSSANGNLDFSVSNDAAMGSTISVSSGKWYWEMTVVSGHSSGSNTVWTAITSITPSSSNKLAWQAGSGSRSYATTGLKYSENTSASYGNTYTNGDVIGCALDLDNGKVYWSKNGTFQASGDPVAGTNAAYTGLTGSWMPEATQNGAVTAWNFGQRPFAYTAPSGFKALCTTNLPTPTIGATSTTQANDYFDVKTWSGNSSTQSIALEFAPGLIWNKSRSGAAGHAWWDVVRGTGAQISSSETNAESTGYNAITSFSNNAISLGADNTGTSNGRTNETGRTYVGWVWNAGGSNATNTSGTITSTVRANTTSGFSIVTYTGTGANATVGHGLGVAPSMVILKDRGSVNSWYVWHSSLTGSQCLLLNLTNAVASSSTFWNSTIPSSTVFSLGTDSGPNRSTGTYVAYCFAPVAGYSAFGSYTGNGSTDGPFVYVGFRPRYLMVKEASGTSAASGNWVIHDAVRDTYNVCGLRLVADNSYAEGTVNAFDFLSNGFKLRTTDVGRNESGGTYIYMAFAETPAKFSLAR